jgi:hypothetical protein
MSGKREMLKINGTKVLRHPQVDNDVLGENHQIHHGGKPIA